MKVLFLTLSCLIISYIIYVFVFQESQNNSELSYTEPSCYSGCTSRYTELIAYKSIDSQKYIEISGCYTPYIHFNTIIPGKTVQEQILNKISLKECNLHRDIIIDSLLDLIPKNQYERSYWRQENLLVVQVQNKFDSLKIFEKELYEFVEKNFLGYEWYSDTSSARSNFHFFYRDLKLTINYLKPFLKKKNILDNCIIGKVVGRDSLTNYIYEAIYPKNQGKKFIE